MSKFCLQYVFDWKGFVIPYLADPQLANHSKYNSFKLEKEEGRVKLRAKRLPQHSDSELVPRAGIQLLKDDICFEAVGPAGFRTEEIKFDQIFTGIRKLTSSMTLEDKMKIQTSWDNLRQVLESMPAKVDNLRKMNISELPTQAEENLISEQSVSSDCNVEHIIVGNVCPESIEEGDLEEDLEVGMDVCVYTLSKCRRPWVGRTYSRVAA